MFFENVNGWFVYQENNETNEKWKNLEKT